MKFSKKDIINILWHFDQLGGEEIIDDRLVKDIRVTNPNPKNTLLQFSFKDVNYFALFDELFDDIDSISEQIHIIAPNALLEPIKNPKSSQLSFPFKAKEMYLLKELNPKKRLDVFLSENSPNLTRSAYQKLIKDGRVSVNGVVSKKSNLLVSGKDKISIEYSEEDFSKDELPVIYEDGNVLVINKPAGVLSHAKGNETDEFTAAKFFERYNIDQPETNRVGIVHRLDRDTSGVMIGAKSSEALSKLQKQFSSKKAKKTYFAVVKGVPKEKEALIDLPIARNMKFPTTFLVSPNGRPAQTHYRIKESNGKYSLLEVSPATGRTHQIRVHLNYIGNPIVGDRVYKGEPANRLFLHASELEITLPTSERRTFKAPVPKEFLDKVK